MKFIYLLCISLIIFSYVQALLFKDDSLSSDEIYELPYPSDNIIYKKKSETLPPHAPSVYPVIKEQVTPKPSIFKRIKDVRDSTLLTLRDHLGALQFTFIGLLARLEERQKLKQQQKQQNQSQKKLKKNTK
uniref:Corticotropin-releasing factor domain-containing protein n=1 Tax=Tetranychus urticae TaxID=32264 RepID=T1JYM0_TETUR